MRQTHLKIQPFNSLMSSVTFLYPLKTSENLHFSDIFRGYKNVMQDINGLKQIWSVKYTLGRCSHSEHCQLKALIDRKILSKYQVHATNTFKDIAF